MKALKSWGLSIINNKFSFTHISYTVNIKKILASRQFSEKCQHNHDKLNLTKFIQDLEFGDKSIKSLNYFHSIKEEDNKVTLFVNLHPEHRKISDFLTKEVTKVLADKSFIIKLAPITKEDQKKSKSDIKKNLSKIKHIIAVSSCKGGVGKSTVAVNLASALKLIERDDKKRNKIGIFDADIHGPSLPIMLNTQQKQAYCYEDDKDTIIPIEFDNMKVMSYGFAAPGKRAVVRGPIVSGIVSSLLLNTDWGELDYLIVDFPPGTGDIQLSLCQEASFSGAVIVTTPQKLSFVDVIKGIEMFDELKIPILAAVENMAYFKCENCDVKHKLFGEGYLTMLKKQFGIEDSFEIPIEKKISTSSDSGSPFVLTYNGISNSQGFEEFINLAASLHSKVNSDSFALITNPPKVTYEQGEVRITNSDGNLLKVIEPRQLRLKCICAACINEFTGDKILKDEKIPANVHPRIIEARGNYAVSMVWSDGHRSSIYPYKRLLSEQIPSKI